MNLMNLYQDKFPDVQEFCDQTWQCEKIVLGRCTDDAKAIQKEQGNISATSAQIKKALDKIEDEHHAIIFLYSMPSNLFTLADVSRMANISLPAPFVA